MGQVLGSQQAPVSAAQVGQSRAYFNKRKGTSGIEGQLYEIEDFKKFYESNAEKPTFSKDLDIFNLYQLFIDKKFLIFCEEKKKEDSTNVSVQDGRQNCKDCFESGHMLLALSMLLLDEEVNKLLSKGETRRLKVLKENVNKGREKTGIVIQMDMDNNKPIFIHRTFAEYYAAYWFADNTDKEFVKQFLLEHLFEEDFKVIRHFFDRFLCNDNQVIITTLNNDKNTLANLLTQKTKEVICQCDEEGRTALHAASAYGYLDIVRILLKHIDINVSDNLFGWRPLAYAIENNHWNVVALLLQEGASSDDLVQGQNIPVKKYGYKNNTLLHKAADEGYSKLVETLVIKYGDIVNTRNEHKETPLHLAASRGHLEVLSVLLKHNADIDAQDVGGQTPLHWSARNGELEVTTWLIQQNADINARDVWGWSPLHLSALLGQLDIVKILFENGASLSETKYGYTVLRCAVDGGSLEIVQYLVEQRIANVNEIDELGESVLQFAIRIGKSDVAEYLLRKGARNDQNS